MFWIQLVVYRHCVSDNYLQTCIYSAMLLVHLIRLNLKKLRNSSRITNVKQVLINFKNIPDNGMFKIAGCVLSLAICVQLKYQWLSLTAYIDESHDWSMLIVQCWQLATISETLFPSFLYLLLLRSIARSLNQ